MKGKPLHILTLFISILLLPTIAYSLSCSCGSYPCSSGTCSGDYCSSNTYYEYTGGCLSDGFGGGYCETTSEACGGDYCLTLLGCVECLNSGDCNPDYYYCSGNNIYERDFRCSGYSCTYDNDFIEDCDDRDGNYCSGDSAYFRDYSCAGSFCSYSPSLLKDCGVEDTAWSDYYCITATKSYSYRYLGVCDLLEIDYCSTVLDDDIVSCSYGCAQKTNEKEYEYKCTGANTYKLYEREIEGLCRQESSETWVVSGLGLTQTCSNNYMCENDELISAGTPSSPCERFAVSSSLNQSTITQGNDFTITSSSSQTYVPDVLLYDYTNDGVYDIGYGSACNTAIQNTYCAGASCCNSGSPFTTTTTITASDLGNKQVRVLALEQSQGWSYTTTRSYTVSSAYVVSIILEDRYVQVEKNVELKLDDNSFGNPQITTQCWRDSGYLYECYGDSDNCAVFCPGYDFVNEYWFWDFTVDTSKTGTRNVYLYSSNGNQSDSDVIKVCVYDYSSGAYCGTCNDGLQNDDETGVDTGGHCGNCTDGIKNGLETYIDYGGNCGTCYDGVQQSFETLDIDYGGLCGNCTGDKETDTYWALGHSLSSDVPFDTEYCGDKTESLVGFISFFVTLVIGSLFILIFVVLALLFIVSLFLGGTIGAVFKTIFDKVIKRFK